MANYDKAKQFYERVSNFYQKERWWSVLAHIQVKPPPSMSPPVPPPHLLTYK